jgi:hypothetical protein
VYGTVVYGDEFPEKDLVGDCFCTSTFHLGYERLDNHRCKEERVSGDNELGSNVIRMVIGVNYSEIH